MIGGDGVSRRCEGFFVRGCAMKGRYVFRVAASIVLVVAVMAGAAAHEPAVGERGEATRAWLQYQRSGDHASASERPMPGDVAERVYHRYLQSFSHPIPETFERQRGFTTGQ